MQHLDERLERWRQLESAALVAEEACRSSLRSSEDASLREDAARKRRFADSYLAAIREEVRVAPAPPRTDAHGSRDQGLPPAAPRDIERP